MDMNTVVLAIAALIGTAMVCFAAIIAWRGWLGLKLAELEKNATPSPPPSAINTRIELADLRERLRKLEAIAAGIEL